MAQMKVHDDQQQETDQRGRERHPGGARRWHFEQLRDEASMGWGCNEEEETGMQWDAMRCNDVRMQYDEDAMRMQ